MSKVALDTHILIWGVQGTANEGQEHKIQLAKSLIQNLEEDDAAVLVPSIVVGEFLLGLPEEKHKEAISIINSYFQVADYNALSSARAAEAFKQSADDGLYDTLKQSPGVVRQEIMVDHHIVGCMVSHDVDVLFSEDSALSSVAQKHMTVRDLPANQAEMDFSPGASSEKVGQS
jgi:predicted nucleic acid-binding protein